MKALIALFLAGVSCVSLASERIAEQAEQSAEPYSYASQPDIAKVISHHGNDAETCGPVAMQMVYEDHQGLRHTMEYQAMGSGCSRG